MCVHAQMERVQRDRWLYDYDLYLEKRRRGHEEQEQKKTDEEEKKVREIVHDSCCCCCLVWFETRTKLLSVERPISSELKTFFFVSKLILKFV